MFGMLYYALVSKQFQTIGLGVMVFHATFNNISAIEIEVQYYITFVKEHNFALL
jgi:hypothetical protein